MDKNFKQTSFLFGSNAVFIEELYQLYLSDHTAVDKSWQNYFQNIENNNSHQVNKSTAHVITSPHEREATTKTLRSSRNDVTLLKTVSSSNFRQLC